MPDIDDREGERRLDPQSVTVDRLSNAIVASILSIGLLVGAVIFTFVNPYGPVVGLLSLVAWVVLAAALVGLVLWWPGLSYRHTSYRVSGQGIRIRRGVLWRSVHFIPRSRVQHTDVSQGPIERLFELATLVVYTAGTEYAATSLSGLRHETALRIRDHLIEGEADDAV